VDSDEAVEGGGLARGWNHRRNWVRALILSVLSAPGTVHAQVTLEEIVTRALEHAENAETGEVNQAVASGECKAFDGPKLFEDPDETVWTGTVRALTEKRAPTPHLLATVEAQSAAKASVQTQDRREYVALCAAQTYVQLATVDAQIEAIRDQQRATARLVKIEKNRVHEKVDDPDRVTRARLYEARASLWSIELERFASGLRVQLSVLTGLQPAEAVTVRSSIPALPVIMKGGREEQGYLREVLAARDVVQLEYELAHSNRMELTGRIAVGTANLADLVTAYIREREKLDILLDVERIAKEAQIESLYSSGELEKWALQRDGFPIEPFDQDLGSRRSPATTFVTIPAASSSEKPMMRVMITPAVGRMMVGHSQAFSAIAVYSDGSAKDVTRQTTWTCSSDSDAILSTGGLLTTLSVGDVVITATVGYITQKRSIETVPEDPSLLNP
jgi:hypothetical protein